MPWAAAGAAVIGAGATLYGNSQQSKAVSKAADQAQATQEQAMALSTERYNTARNDLMPYIGTGTTALRHVLGLSGAGTAEMGDEARAAYQTSPGYEFALQEGARAIENSAAARGMTRSGATMKALQDRAIGVANQDFGNYFNRLYQVAGLGQNAAAGVGNAGTAAAAQNQSAANNIAQTQVSEGTALANIYGANAAAVSKGVNSIYSVGEKNDWWGNNSPTKS